VVSAIACSPVTASWPLQQLAFNGAWPPATVPPAAAWVRASSLRTSHIPSREDNAACTATGS